MPRFTHFLAIDWSGAKGERQSGIALALADVEGGPPVLVKSPRRGWAREEVLHILRHELPPDTLVGMDLGFSLPHADCSSFFPGWDRSPDRGLDLWRYLRLFCWPIGSGCACASQPPLEIFLFAYRFAT